MTMRNPARLLVLVLPPLLAASFALAQADKQVVYRLVDKKGKTTYSEKAPGKDFDGKVTRIEVDLKANIATLKAVGESSPPVSLPLTSPEMQRVKANAELTKAIAALEAAKKALEEGKAPKEEEIQRVGKVGGGARPVLTADYEARLKSLEDAVKSAEAEVDRARKEARLVSID
jgi:hypothetical protein